MLMDIAYFVQYDNECRQKLQSGYNLTENAYKMIL